MYWRGDTGKINILKNIESNLKKFYSYILTYFFLESKKICDFKIYNLHFFDYTFYLFNVRITLNNKNGGIKKWETLKKD